MSRTALLYKTSLRLALLTPIIVVAYLLAWMLRYDFALPTHEWVWFWRTLPCVLAIKLVAASTLQGWHEWMRYVSFRDLVVLAGTLFAASISIFVCEWFFLSRLGDGFGIPLAVIILDYALSLLFIGAACSAWRFRREHFWPLVNLLLRRGRYRPALLVGANRTGVVLANQIQFHPKLRYHVVGFLDADERLHGTRFGGLLVRGRLDDVANVAQQCGAKDVFVLDGSLSGRILRRLMSDCRAAGVHIRIIANIYDLVPASGRQRRLAVRDVDINDLLRREPVDLDDAALDMLLHGQVVMVSGAGGSIGSEICRQVLRYHPRTLALVERAENSLFQIDRELRSLSSDVEIIPFVADITDLRRMRQVFDACRPQVLFHAAAHKHVPMMETNPGEAIENNVFGTKLVADLADEYEVRTFVLISTDKAVRPTSVMGLSKQIAERYVHALSQSSRTRYVVVRFGNVLGSAGSVVPIFQEQIQRGGPITVTHPEMRRYFMTIPEASQLVLQAGAMGCGGEIFVLDMGEPVRIIDLAHDLIRLSGLDDDEIEIKFSGIRPGEKLYEELYFDDEQTLHTPHSKLRAACFRPSSIDEIGSLLDDLQAVVDESDPVLVHQRLRQLFPEFCASAVDAATLDADPLEHDLATLSENG